jgi:hypothetical protein
MTTLAQRRYIVARQLVAVSRSLDAFSFKGEQYLSRAVSETLKEAERAFAVGSYDRTEHLTKVAAPMIKREEQRFAANPQAWIAKRPELRI